MGPAVPNNNQDKQISYQSHRNQGDTRNPFDLLTNFSMIKKKGKNQAKCIAAQRHTQN